MLLVFAFELTIRELSGQYAVVACCSYSMLESTASNVTCAVGYIIHIIWLPAYYIFLRLIELICSI